MTTGKIYAGLLIYENWLASGRLNQRQAPVRIVVWLIDYCHIQSGVICHAKLLNLLFLQPLNSAYQKPKLDEIK